jgi:cytochrome c551/c552
MVSWQRIKLSGRFGGRISPAWAFAAFVLVLVVIISGSILVRSGTAAAASATLSEDQMADMSSSSLAKYVFNNQGCSSCHTVSSDGKLGFTDRGKQLGKGFEGCTALLTAMNVIAQVPQASRTSQERAKAARFQEFGCASCHRIVPGTMGLTKYAPKLKSLHQICTEIECTSCEGEKK